MRAAAFIPHSEQKPVAKYLYYLNAKLTPSDDNHDLLDLGILSNTCITTSDQVICRFLLVFFLQETVEYMLGNLQSSRTRILEYSMNTDQAPVVQKVDNAIHWINRYPVDKYLSGG